MFIEKMVINHQKSKNGFSTYPSRNKHQYQNQPTQPEINAMAKSDDLSAIKND